jgi:hypothetical protein
VATYILRLDRLESCKLLDWVLGAGRKLSMGLPLPALTMLTCDWGRNNDSIIEEC